MNFRFSKMLTTVALSLFISSAPGWSLPLGEPQAAHFTREALRTLREIIALNAKSSENAVEFDLSGKTIRETDIKSASIIFKGYSQAQITSMRETGINADDLTAGDAIEVEATISATAINSLIRREIARVNSSHRILDQLSIKFLDDQIRVEGLVDFRKIPGNVLAFMVQDFSPFTATIAIESAGSQINLNIIDATVNNQPMTPELRAQIHTWMNPVWDFSILPYRAELDRYDLSPAGVSFAGSISH
ncbi:MAG TPA: hypothetical protein PLM07_16420 [Candidatus Rifleibacterium sp.]|nr:hypothetical protein [Candidatus Rifleibacterium sp.]HPT47468.1 hypothetical protein [Candidatus Rifleibacterium sp.]